MMKIIEKISFLIPLSLLIYFILYVITDGIQGYSEVILTNIITNLCALIMGLTMNIFLLMDKERSKTFTSLFTLILFTFNIAVSLNIFQNIFYDIDNNSIYVFVFDVARMVFDQITAILFTIYFVRMFNIPQKNRNRINLITIIVSISLLFFYILPYISFGKSTNEILTAKFDILFMPVYILFTYYNFIFLYILIKYSKNKNERIPFIVFNILFLFITIIRTISIFDIGYAITSLVILQIYVYMYLKRVNSEIQSKKYAKDIQKSIIRSDFDNVIENVEIYGRILPADDITGDYYDYFRIDDNHICFSISHIPGFGISAAIQGSEELSMLRGLLDTSTHPNGIAEILSLRVKRFNSKHKDSTLWFGILNTTTNVLSYVVAGHNDFVILRDGKPLDIVYKTSPKIGENKREKFRCNEIVLENNDIVILYSSGIKYHFRNSSPKFKEKIINSQANLINIKPENLVNNLYSLIKNDSGTGHVERDLVMLAVKINDSNAHYINNDLIQKTLKDSNKINIESQVLDEVLQISLSGVLNDSTVYQFENYFIKSIKDYNNYQSIIIDCNKLDDISIAGVYSLIKCRQSNDRDIIVSFGKCKKEIFDYLINQGLSGVFTFNK